jgi:hypothetical protein
MSATDGSELGRLVNLHRRSQSLGFRPTTGRTIGLVVNFSLLLLIAYLAHWSYRRHKFNQQQQRQIVGLEDSWRNIKVLAIPSRVRRVSHLSLFVLLGPLGEILCQSARAAHPGRCTEMDEED